MINSAVLYSATLYSSCSVWRLPRCFILWVFFAVEGFCLQAEQCWPSALLPPVNLRGCQSCHRNGESRPLQSLQPLGKCSEQTAAQTPTQTKFLLDEDFTNQLWNNHKAWLTGPQFLNNRNLSKTNWLSFKQTPWLSLFFFFFSFLCWLSYFQTTTGSVFF